MASLAIDAAEGVTKANNLGLLSVDSTGELRLLLRTGEFAGVRIIKDFTALVPAVGSLGAASGHDNAGHIAATVTTIDGTVEPVVIDVP